MSKNIHIHTIIEEDLYNRIKSYGFKINLLIARGYECLTGKCSASEALKNEVDECKKKLAELETKSKNDIENLIKKFADENSELKIIKTYLITLLQHLINKYIKTREKFYEELSEAFKDEERKQRFIRFIEERKIFIHYL
ncbi:MAG: hypothetical protein QW184_01880 [Nanopusillaceae archaeon]